MPSKTTEDRFWRKVNKTDGCWLWTAAKALGYGKFWNGTRLIGAHQFAYELMRGPVDIGLELDHLCRNPACVNPDHLEPVPHRINMQRGETGKATGALNKAKTHCKRGHPYSPDNTYIHPTSGQRCCRACRLQWKRNRYRARKRELKTHCPKGHAYSDANTYFNPTTGHRACRECRKQWSRTPARRKAATERMRNHRAAKALKGT